MSTKTTDETLWEWPLVAYPFVLAISLPLIAFEVLDMARVIFAYAPEFKGKVLLIVLLQNFALLPAFAVCAYFPSRRGLQGAYLAVLGGCAAAIVCFNFRGAYVRLGTFDLFAVSYWSWLRFLLIGIACGVIAGLLVAGSKPLLNIARPALYWIPPVALMLAGLASHLVTSHYQEESMFAPTRAYALIAIGIVLFLVFVAAEVCRRSYEAKSVYSR